MMNNIPVPEMLDIFRIAGSVNPVHQFESLPSIVVSLVGIAENELGPGDNSVFRQFMNTLDDQIIIKKRLIHAVALPN